MKSYTFTLIVLLILLTQPCGGAVKLDPNDYLETTAALRILYVEACQFQNSLEQYAINASKQRSSQAEAVFAAMSTSNRIIAKRIEIELDSYGIASEIPETLKTDSTRLSHDLKFFLRVKLGRIEEKFLLLRKAAKCEKAYNTCNFLTQIQHVRNSQQQAAAQAIDSMGLLGIFVKKVDTYHVCSKCGFIGSTQAMENCQICESSPSETRQISKVTDLIFDRESVRLANARNISRF